MVPLRRTVTISNELGLHARPAALFVQLASRFPCDVWVERADMRVNGKSIMGIMMLAAEQGTSLVLEADGDQAEGCLEALSALVSAGFELNR
jgi:phosphocarrier protein HPr